jgi:hypothetical protein
MTVVNSPKAMGFGDQDYGFHVPKLCRGQSLFLHSMPGTLPLRNSIHTESPQLLGTVPRQAPHSDRPKPVLMSSGRLYLNFMFRNYSALENALCL